MRFTRTILPLLACLALLAPAAQADTRDPLPPVEGATAAEISTVNLDVEVVAAVAAIASSARSVMIHDSEDPMYGAGERPDEVRRAMLAVTGKVAAVVDWPIGNMSDVVSGPEGPIHQVDFTERELRILRFALHLARGAVV